MLFFDITNRPLDLHGDALIEAATKFIEEADRKKQEELALELAKTQHQNEDPPPWPEPEPDSGSSTGSEEQGSEFKSDATASPISTSKVLELLYDNGEGDQVEEWGGSEQAVQSLAIGPAYGIHVEPAGALSEYVRASDEIGAHAVGPAGDDAAWDGDASPSALEDVESIAKQLHLLIWLEEDLPQARQAYKDWLAEQEAEVAAHEAELEEIQERWALAMADGERYRAEAAEREAAGAASRAEAAERVRVQLAADAEAYWAMLAAEEAATTITSHTAENADNETNAATGADEAASDEESDEDGVFRGLIDFNALGLH